MVKVHIQHTSMQFSDDLMQHRHDARAIFNRAASLGVWACTGTEAAKSRHNHDLRDALITEARANNFFIYAQRHGEWVALNRKYLHDLHSGYAGPYIHGTSGIRASQGAHTARGITWASGKARVKDLGVLTFGAVHFMTNRSEAVSGSNQPLINGIGKWGEKFGAGSDVVFLGGDVNESDRSHSVFKSKPFRSIADELGKWPATRAGHPIDVIASYNHDGRVKATSYHVLDDKDFFLYTDHYLLDAVYEVDERAGKVA